MNYNKKIQHLGWAAVLEQKPVLRPDLAVQEVKGEERKKINKKKLINKLNYLHFYDGTILVRLRHQKFESEIILEAKPDPCFGDLLNCRWVGYPALIQKLDSYRVENFLLSDGLKLVLAEPKEQRFDEHGAALELPDFGYELSSRKLRRHECCEVDVEFFQNGVCFSGKLMDFSPVAFKVMLNAVPPQTFQWIHPETFANIVLKKNNEVVYSGLCEIGRQEAGSHARVLVMQPIEQEIQRFKPKTVRSPRHCLLPSPTVSFRHPLTNKPVQLQVKDISGSGISVEEHYDQSLLLPGMVVNDLLIELGGQAGIKAKVQFVYRNEFIDEDNTVQKVQCGLAFLDMNMDAQRALSSILHHAENNKSFVCNKVDIESLWRFFFDTGFIYPQKYVSINSYKEKFKETYEKLYVQDQNIARYFIHQDKGVILGHFSMIRFYEKSWIIQHHAGDSAGYNSGLCVLNQIGRYANDFRCLYSTNMDYLMGYYRPKNKFPDRIWGQFTRETNDPKKTSLDTFAYFHLLKGSGPEVDDDAYQFVDTTEHDLNELQSFYGHISGGLLLHAMDLLPGSLSSNTIDEEYKRYSMTRKRRLFSLKQGNSLKAIVSVTISDLGLNLSNLTNCIHVFVVDQEDTQADVLLAKTKSLLDFFVENEVPALVYPHNYAENNALDFEKLYNLWVINTQFGDDYLLYIKKLLNKE